MDTAVKESIDKAIAAHEEALEKIKVKTVKEVLRKREAIKA